MLNLLAKRPLTWLTLCVALWLTLTLWWNRAVFITTYDLKYVSQLYDQSQWRIPQSPRVIADDQIYPIAGVSQLETGELFTVNPEVPPLGKYLYGWAALYLGNPYLMSLLLYIGTLVLFWRVSLLVLFPLDPARPKQLAALSTLALATTSLFVAQLSQTMLDLPQLFFLILHVWAVLHVVPSRSWRSNLTWLAIAGLSLGWFSTVKVGVFAPMVGLASWWWLRKTKWWLTGPWLAGWAGIGFLLPHAHYIFSQDNFLTGLIEFAKIQKWILNFYADSDLPAQKGMVFLTAFGGWFKGWWTDATWQWVVDRDLMWPVGIACLVWALATFRHAQTQPATRQLRLIAILGLGLLAGLAVVPFWPRYFLLILPWGILGTVAALRSRPRIMTILIASLAINTAWVNQPQVTISADRAEKYFTGGLFQDLYSVVDLDTQRQLSRDQFYRLLKGYQQDWQVWDLLADISVPSSQPWEGTVQGQATFRWHTAIGVVETNRPITFVRQHNTWRLKWEWPDAIAEYQLGDKVIFEPIVQAQGIMRTEDGRLASQPGPRQELVVMPNELENVRNAAQVIANLTANGNVTELQTVEIEHRIVIDALPDRPVVMGQVRVDATADQIASAAAIPGLSFRPTTGRTYAPWVLANPTALARIWKLEADTPHVWPEIGGNLKIVRTGAPELVILQRPGKPGQNITLEQTQAELSQP